MKKLLFLSALIVSAFFATSCNDNDDNDTTPPASITNTMSVQEIEASGEPTAESVPYVENNVNIVFTETVSTDATSNLMKVELYNIKFDKNQPFTSTYTIEGVIEIPSLSGSNIYELASGQISTTITMVGNPTTISMNVHDVKITETANKYNLSFVCDYAQGGQASGAVKKYLVTYTEN